MLLFRLDNRYKEIYINNGTIFLKKFLIINNFLQNLPYYNLTFQNIDGISRACKESEPRTATHELLEDN
jgi:hypothetical protein